MNIKDTNAKHKLDSAIIDPSFGDLGTVSLAIPGASSTMLRGLTQSASGDLYATGTAVLANQPRFWIARLDSEGQLDNTFGQQGFVTGQFSADDDFPIFSFGEHIYLVTHGVSEYILLCGRAYDSESGPNALARFTLQGNLDPTFGIAGKLVIHIDLGFLLSPQPTAPQKTLYEADTTTTYSIVDGKLLLTRIYSLRPTHNVSLIIRLDLNGAPDMTFNGKGFVIVRHPDYTDDITAVASLMPFNDKYIVVGYLTREQEKSRAFVACYNNNGTLDATFNNGGYFILSSIGPEFTNPYFSKVVKQLNNRILAIGGTSFSVYRGLLVSLEANGLPNIQFNNAKPLTTALDDGETSWLTGATPARDSTIFATGTWHNPKKPDFDLDWCVARFLDNGKPDLSFHKTGFGILRLSSGEDYPTSIIEVSNSKLVVAGVSGVTGKRVASLVRIFAY